MKKFSYLLFFFILFLSIIMSIGIGPTKIGLSTILKILFDVTHCNAAQEAIILQIRLPRILLAVLVGACLSGSGCIMQGLFRNPMADPFILGVSSGAAVGAALAIVLEFVTISIYYIPFFAFICSSITIVSVYTLARSNGHVSVENLLLSGIAMSTFLSAVLSFLIYVSEQWLHSLYFWLLGGFGTANWNHVFLIIPFAACGLIGSFIFSRDLNIMLLGEESAKHLGVEVDTIKWILVLLTALMTAAAVSVSGIIGFVGLIIPHMVRIFTGPDHRTLLPLSVLVGGIFMIWTDNVARTLISPSELPVGIVTAFFGAPFFIYLLRKKKGDLFEKS